MNNHICKGMGCEGSAAVAFQLYKVKDLGMGFFSLSIFNFMYAILARRQQNISRASTPRCAHMKGINK